MTDAQKLLHVLTELKSAALPDRSSLDYWPAVEVRSNNAVDEICNIDRFIKNLIQVIES